MENLLDKAKAYLFPAQKVLDKAAAQGNKTVGATIPMNTDTSYIQNIVKQRMAEKKNPLVNKMSKKK